MTLDDIRPNLSAFSDREILALLTEVSAEVKRRNTILNGILGTAPPEVRREAVKQGIQTILEAIKNDSIK
jgi:hypothetical protein